MAAPLLELVEPLKAALTPAGGTLPDETLLIEKLANAFWEGHLRGFFDGYRVTGVGDDRQIEALDADADDLDRALQQIIVKVAFLEELRTRLVNLPHSTRRKVGPVETEAQQHASVLVQLMRDGVADLKELKQDLGRDARADRFVAFIDGVQARTNAVIESCTGWVA